MHEDSHRHCEVCRRHFRADIFAEPISVESSGTSSILQICGISDSAKKIARAIRIEEVKSGLHIYLEYQIVSVRTQNITYSKYDFRLRDLNALLFPIICDSEKVALSLNGCRCRYRTKQIQGRPRKDQDHSKIWAQSGLHPEAGQRPFPSQAPQILEKRNWKFKPESQCSDAYV